MTVAAQLVLLTGWFSFDTAEVTAGDLLAARTAERWLRGAGLPHRVAVAANFRSPSEVAWADVDPREVTDVVFVCGPLAGELVESLFARFPDARHLAAGVSVVEGSGRLGTVRSIPRDGPGGRAADLAFGSPVGAVPVIGVVRAHDQPEYGSRQDHASVHRRIDELLLRRDVAPVELDTRLHPGEAHLCSTPGQFVSAVARCDAVLTTRLHGLVLGLRAGVPVVAVDPVRGGAKVTAQAAAVGWPAVVSAEAATAAGGDPLGDALDWCLTDHARDHARRAAAGTEASLEASRDQLLAALGPTGVPA